MKIKARVKIKQLNVCKSKYPSKPKDVKNVLTKTKGNNAANCCCGCFHPC